jgi:methyl-accepting chemotaxis protein
VSTATDEQAASAEEIAAMVDDARDRANQVADEVREVARAAERQTEKVAEIERSVGQLRGDSA